MHSQALLFILTAILTGPVFAGEEATTRAYTDALRRVEDAAKQVEAELNKAFELDGQAQQIQQKIGNIDNQIQNLQQTADDIANNAANAANAGAPQGSGAGGGSGGGSGGGGGGKGGGMEGKEPPKLGEAPKFELPIANADPQSLSDIADRLAFKPGRGIGASDRTDFTGSAFDPNAFRLNGGSQNPSAFTPGNIASGNLPLLGGTSPGNPISNQASVLDGPGTGGPAAGNSGQGMMGGGMGGALGAPSGAADGDSFGSVGREDDDGPSPKINTEMLAVGSGGDGGESGVSATGDSDESPVERQRSNSGDTLVINSERGIENPEARGLMTYVGTGFLKELCSNKAAAVGVCLGPLPVVAAAPTERAIASTPDLTPVQASSFPQRSETARAGILGLLSGK